MRKYELLLVLPGTLDEQEVEAKTGEVLAVINEYGQNTELTVLGKNRLAYPIKQVRYGYFYTVVFSAEPENVKKIEEKLKLSRGLLRAIVSHFNAALASNQKLTYFADTVSQEEPEQVVIDRTEAPAIQKIEEPTVAVETPAEDAMSEPAKEEPVKEEIRSAPKAKTLDLKEIDKKLDEILADDSINI